jgi:CheY-like chemotaxis protein
MNTSDNSLPRNLHILLTDDDLDDCQLFQETVESVSNTSHITTLHDGEQLMQFLNHASDTLPDVIFLDLNMPRKNGFTSLEEIKQDERLRHIPVIIFSTSCEDHVADLLYKNGALYYICKPTSFTEYKNVIHTALALISEPPIKQPPRQIFLLRSQPSIQL